MLIYCGEILSNPFAMIPNTIEGKNIKPLVLNGNWKFLRKTDKSYNLIKNISSLEDIKVPGEWLMQGFEIGGDERVAYYKKFKVSNDWRGKLIKLRFDALHSDAQVFLNGKRVGDFSLVATAQELDVTNQVEIGKENILCVGLKSLSLADTLASYSQYATHTTGGIIRKVQLFAVPQNHITSFSYSTELNFNCTSAIIALKYCIQADDEFFEIEENFEFDHKKQNFEILKIDKEYLNGKYYVTKTIRVNNPKLWNCETPNLYNMDFNLKIKDRIVEQLNKKIGLRQIEIVANNLFVNKVPIKLKGVNRHEVHPLLGRSLNMKLWRKDVELFKQANVNYIRTSHYPPAEEFIQLCDSIGLFVELESAFCWVGHGANSKWKEADFADNAFNKIIKLTHENTISFYKNYPSIIIWSMANESAWSPLWEKAYRRIKKLDNTRPISFHDQSYGGYNNFGSSMCDIANMHYPGPSGPKVAQEFERPILFGEYAHLNTYNRQEIKTDPAVRDMWGKDFYSMWNNMYHSRGCLGGAIWSGIDDFFILPNKTMVGYGEWGPIDAWRRSKPEYWHMKKSYSPVRVFNTEFESFKEMKLLVQNRFFYTNLKDVEFELSQGNINKTVKLEAKPGVTSFVSVPNSFEFDEKKDVNLKITYNNTEIDRYKLSVPKNKSYKINKSNNYLCEATDDYLRVKARDKCWEIDKRSGLISAIKNNDEYVMDNEIGFMLLPLKSGPCKTEHSLNIKLLNEKCKNWKMHKLYNYMEDSSKIVCIGEYNEAKVKYEYIFNTTGYVNINYSLVMKKDINPRQIGVVFPLSKDYVDLSWSKKSFWSCYPSDHIGRTEGKASFETYKFDLNSAFKEPENRWFADKNELGSNDFRSSKTNIYWASLSNGKLSFTTFSDAKSYVRCFGGKAHVSMLIGNFITGGNDIFFASHHSNTRMKLNKGASYSSSIRIKF
jgi:hypothetical protein